MTSMNPDRYEQIRRLFIDVCELDPLHRSAVLEERCLDDPELRSEVESLLMEEQQHQAMLRESRLGKFAEVVHGLVSESIGAPIPRALGKYRLLRKIGEGGMGAVFEAEQENPRRRVALKMVRPGVVSPAMLRRFSHEADVLGRLQHPGIAQIHDAGMADTGQGQQPYFVMELVYGQPLIDFASRRNLSTRQRLELMAKVADAVHHAHIKGVVHRDLKPGNILVSEEAVEASSEQGTRSREPQPKILDFGVARATDSDIHTTTLHTDVGQLIGTVPYMSPEQATGDTDQIDTRSDVYAMGIVCYELLAGKLPYELERVKIHEAVRIIREDEPSKLSTLNRIFRGDVETIVSKALEKDKERRYQSAADFAADIRRHLNDEPIEARPASTMYQMRKFAKRNKALVGGVAGIIVALAVGMATTTYWLAESMRQRNLAHEAEQVAGDRLREVTAANNAEVKEADKARAVTRFFQTMFSFAGPDTARGRPLTVHQLLDETVDKAVIEFESQPETQAAVQTAAGGAFLELGELQKARDYLNAAFETQRRLLGPDHAETLMTMTNLGSAYVEMNQFKEARALLDEALDRSRRTFGDDHSMTLHAASSFGLLLYAQGEWDQAEPILGDTLARLTHVNGEKDLGTLATMSRLGMVYLAKRQFEKAEPLFEKMLERSRELNGPDHPQTMHAMQSLATLRYDQGHNDAALDLLDQALAAQRRVLGDSHTSTLATIMQMASVFSDQGNVDRAESLAREANQLATQSLGTLHTVTLDSMQSLSMVLQRKGEFAEAADIAQRALEAARELLGPQHPDIAKYMQATARALQMSGRKTNALAMYRDTLAFQQRVLGEDHLDVLTTMNNLGQSFLELGQLDESEPLLAKAVELRQARLGREHPQTLTSMNNFATLLRMRRRFDEAAAVAVETLEIRKRVLGPDHPETLTSMNNLGTIYSDQGQFTLAEKMFAEVVTLRRHVFGSRHPAVANALKNQARMVQKQGRLQEALPMFLEIVQTRVAALGEAHQDTIDSIRDVAKAYKDLGELDNAATSYERALAAAGTAIEPRPKVIAIIQSDYAACLIQQRQFARAEPMLLEALEAFQKSVGISHAQTQGAIKALVDLYESTEKPDKAAEYRAMLTPPDTAQTRPQEQPR